MNTHICVVSVYRMSSLHSQETGRGGGVRSFPEQVYPSGDCVHPLIVSVSPIPVITAMVSAALPCKAKRQYLLTLQVSRYCLLALQSSAAVASTNNAAVVTPCVSN